MNEGVMRWGTEAITEDMVAGKRVLEVGSLDVNGSLAPHVKSFGPKMFVGVDIEGGPGVDVVIHGEDLVSTFGDEYWDLVYSTETLEHCKLWWEVAYQMKESVAKGGWIVITTRSPGYPRHDFPADYWRFTPEIMTEAFGEFQIVDLAKDSIFQPGIFLKAKRTGVALTTVVQAEKAPRPDQQFWVDTKTGEVHEGRKPRTVTKIWPPES